MKKIIDCFFIGYNNANNKKYRSLLALDKGKKYPFNAALHKFDIEHLEYNNEIYSAKQLYNLLIYDKNHSNSIIEDIFSYPIAYLGTFLNKRGFSIDYINSFNQEKEKLKEFLKHKKIRTIVIPTTFYVHMYHILKIISFIRSIDRDVKIILGGPYIFNLLYASKPDDKELQKILYVLGADVYVFSTEGEKTLCSVIDTLTKNDSLNKIKNIFFKKDDKYIFTGVDEEENDLDENVPQWDLFSKKLSSSVNVRTSVSCCFKCAFCTYPICAGKYRELSIDKLEYELNLLHEIGTVKGINFIDDTFNYPPRRFKKILRMMIKNKYNFIWNSHFRCQFADREMLELMKESGCVHVYLGIESGSQEVLNNMNKKVSIDQYWKGMQLLNEYNINSTASIVIGFPGETFQTYRESLKFIEQSKPNYFRVHLWHANSSAPIYKYKEKYNLEGDHYNWSHSTMNAFEAHKLTVDFFLSVKESIFESDCPLPFDLLLKEHSIEDINCFINMFNSCIKNRMNNQTSKNEKIIQNMKSIFSNNIIYMK